MLADRRAVAHFALSISLSLSHFPARSERETRLKWPSCRVSRAVARVARQVRCGGLPVGRDDAMFKHMLCVYIYIFMKVPRLRNKKISLQFNSEAVRAKLRTILLEIREFLRYHIFQRYGTLKLRHRVDESFVQFNERSFVLQPDDVSALPYL